MRNFINNLGGEICEFNVHKFYLQDIIALCNCFGFDIYCDLGDDTYGMVGPQGCRIVIMADTEYPGENAYNLGHELGHHLLGHNPNNATATEEWHANVIIHLLRIPNTTLDRIMSMYGRVDAATIYNALGTTGQNPRHAMDRYAERAKIYWHFKSGCHAPEPLPASYTPTAFKGWDQSHSGFYMC
ncbi:MAG: ImmA/IrrE family metallo-endopeptidase [Proteobacteria bacterium]|nr:ImmA/IrrE family metallo-endopeptidase [Desulfobulbaceae bacterium]MBU4152157.1 ImmA/IrrE family metallo-endopeptidase [Pseudomonadota bacterium]